MPFRRLNIPLTSQATTNPDRPIPAVTLAYDSFTRADTTKGDLGTTETGDLTWEVTGNWRILNERANLVDAVSSWALINVATPNYRVSTTFWRATNGRGGLVFRYIDAANYMLFGKRTVGSSSLRLYQVIDGIETEVLDTGAAGSATNWGSGVLVKGNTCQITAPPAAVTGATITIPDTLAAGTKVGFWGINATTQADLFTVTDK